VRVLISSILNILLFDEENVKLLHRGIESCLNELIRSRHHGPTPSVNERVEAIGSARLGLTPCRGAAVQGRAAPSEASLPWTAAPRHGTHRVLPAMVSGRNRPTNSPEDPQKRKGCGSQE
jgi:hypothetical protein